MTRYLLLILLYTCISLPLSAADSAVLQLYTLDNFKPYSWCDNEIPSGIDIEIIQSALDSTELEYRIGCRPWSRALELAKLPGNGVFAAFRTPQRELYLEFIPTPLHYSNFSFFVNKADAGKVRSIDDLHGMRIGINRGFSVSQAFDLAVARGLISTELVSTTEQNIGKLLKGRLQGFVNNREVTLCQAHRLGVSNQLVEVSLVEHNQRPAYLALSKAIAEKQRSALVEKIDTALLSLQRSERLQQIHSKFADLSRLCGD